MKSKRDSTDKWRLNILWIYQGHILTPLFLLYACVWLTCQQSITGLRCPSRDPNYGGSSRNIIIVVNTFLKCRLLQEPVQIPRSWCRLIVMYRVDQVPMHCSASWFIINDLVLVEALCLINPPTYSCGQNSEPVLMCGFPKICGACCRSSSSVTYLSYTHERMTFKGSSHAIEFNSWIHTYCMHAYYCAYDKWVTWTRCDCFLYL